MSKSSLEAKVCKLGAGSWLAVDAACIDTALGGRDNNPLVFTHTVGGETMEHQVIVPKLPTARNVSFIFHLRAQTTRHLAEL
jgi:hypothetical protein